MIGRNGRGVSARRALIGFARDIFDRRLRGLCDWNAVTFDVAEQAPIPEGRHRNPLGKYRENVVMRFDGFRLELNSPEECPPLGLVEFWIENRILAEGALDQIMGIKIRAAIMKERANVN